MKISLECKDLIIEKALELNKSYMMLAIQECINNKQR